jgi:hypothetical protein
MGRWRSGDPEVTDFLERWSRVSRRTMAAEKPRNYVDLTGEQQGLVGKSDWKTFSRAAGYTPEEIEDFGQRMELYKEGKRLDFSDDELMAMELEVDTGGEFPSPGVEPSASGGGGASRAGIMLPPPIPNGVMRGNGTRQASSQAPKTPPKRPRRAPRSKPPAHNASASPRAGIPTVSPAPSY